MLISDIVTSLVSPSAHCSCDSDLVGKTVSLSDSTPEHHGEEMIESDLALGSGAERGLVSLEVGVGRPFLDFAFECGGSKVVVRSDRYEIQKAAGFKQVTCRVFRECALDRSSSAHQWRQ